MGLTPAERQAAYRKRRQARIDAMPKIPCGCGCGEHMAPLTTTGQPATVIHGHNARLADSLTRAGLFSKGHETWNKGVYEDPEPRFWSKVDTSGDCWKWTGVLSRGYGQLGIEDKMILAHRYSYTLHHGPIPKGLRVCHRCDNRRCVNPKHLFLGTDSDNMRDMVAKGRQRKQNGEANHMAKLTEDDVRAIRAAIDTGPNIAKRFGVSRQLVVAIRSGQRWKHVR